MTVAFLAFRPQRHLQLHPLVVTLLPRPLPSRAGGMQRAVSLRDCGLTAAGQLLRSTPRSQCICVSHVTRAHVVRVACDTMQVQSSVRTATPHSIALLRRLTAGGQCTPQRWTSQLVKSCAVSLTSWQPGYRLKKYAGALQGHWAALRSQPYPIEVAAQLAAGPALPGQAAKPLRLA